MISGFLPSVAATLLVSLTPALAAGHQIGNDVGLTDDLVFPGRGIQFLT